MNEKKSSLFVDYTKRDINLNFGKLPKTLGLAVFQNQALNENFKDEPFDFSFMHRPQDYIFILPVYSQPSLGDVTKCYINNREIEDTVVTILKIVLFETKIQSACLK